jgi:hypothetical protein
MGNGEWGMENGEWRRENGEGRMYKMIKAVDLNLGKLSLQP